MDLLGHRRDHVGRETAERVARHRRRLVERDVGDLAARVRNGGAQSRECLGAGRAGTQPVQRVTPQATAVSAASHLDPVVSEHPLQAVGNADDRLGAERKRERRVSAEPLAAAPSNVRAASSSAPASASS